MEALIVEAIMSLKEPNGSDRAAIAAYIEVKLLTNIAKGYNKCTKLWKIDHFFTSWKLEANSFAFVF